MPKIVKKNYTTNCETNITLAVLTPVYNRSDIIPKLYKSLISQTSFDFVWIIVDDGSSDNLEDVIQTFFVENKIKICYIKKSNGGKHTAINVGSKLINSELTAIVDSDDLMTEDSIEIILNDWKNHVDDVKIGGLCYLKANFDGNVIGNVFPNNGFVSNSIDIKYKHHKVGDAFYVFRTELLKEYPFPVYKGEKFIGESVIWTKISRKFNIIYYNKAIYLCEYLPDGLTNLGRKIRILNPLGGMTYCLGEIIPEIPIHIRIVKMIMYSCYGRFAKKTFSEMLKQVNNTPLFLISYPAGNILYILWKHKHLKSEEF